MTLRLGLIGDHIARSQSPRLHRLAGRQAGIEVRYDSLIPADTGRDFDAVFAQCAQGGFRGVNVTYPYKERAAGLVRIPDMRVRAIGAVNTVIFGAGGAEGHNTDYTGFMAAYARIRGAAQPGPTLVIGAGGVGRAICYALVELGLRDLRLADRDPGKAEHLAGGLRAAAPGLSVTCGADAGRLAVGARGLVNCTPVGMDGHDGTPLPRAAMDDPDWAFDAVYTPADTRFLSEAEAAGAQPVSGWELFFYQGLHAWARFAGLPLDETRLRQDLIGAPS